MMRLLGLEWARRAALRRASPGPLQRYLQQPFPATKTLCGEAEILAVDFETTGLDPKRDHILSMGCVLIRNFEIPLATAQHRYLRIQGNVPENAAAIHHITDDASAQGISLPEAMHWLLNQLRGRVLLAHHAQVELGFLDHACRQLYGVPFCIRHIDTLRIAQRRFRLRNQTIKSGDLRLFNLRRHYKLPQYKAHNALTDALATAELFLAQAAESGELTQIRIGDFCFF